MRPATLLAAVAALCGSAAAQNLALVSGSITPTAGASAGGPFALDAAAADAAGASSGGTFGLVGGLLLAPPPSAPAACNPADINADGTITFGDVSAFIAAFNAGSDDADTTGDGVISFGDVSAFIAAFNDGCP